MAKKAKLDKKYKIMSISDMAHLEQAINEMKANGQSIWLRQVDIGKFTYRIIQISNDCYCLSRDGQNLLFEPTTKDVVDLGQMANNGIDHDKDIPWSKLPIWVERQGKSKKVVMHKQEIEVEKGFEFGECVKANTSKRGRKSPAKKREV